LVSITAAYKPHLQLKPAFVFEKMTSPLRRFPTSFTFLFFSLISFFATLKVPGFIEFIKDKLVFSENASLWQWPMRTFFSQFIYFDSTQFVVLLAVLISILFYIEKEVFDKKWAAYLLAFFVVNEIIIRTFLGLLHEHVQGLENLHSLVHLFPPHGESILIASLAGFSTIFTGVKKDEFFAIGILMFIAASFISSFFGIEAIAILYCTTFYIEGYLIGKFYLNYQSKKDASLAKNKNDDEEIQVSK
jgi:hypothetical protein